MTKDDSGSGDSHTEDERAYRRRRDEIFRKMTADPTETQGLSEEEVQRFRNSPSTHYDSTPEGSTPAHEVAFRSRRDAVFARIFGDEPPAPSGKAALQGAMNRFLDGKWDERHVRPYTASGSFSTTEVERAFASWLSGMYENIHQLNSKSNVHNFLQALVLIKEGNMDQLTQVHIDMLRQGDKILAGVGDALFSAGAAPATLPPALTQASVARGGHSVEDIAAEVYAEEVKPALANYISQRKANLPDKP